MKRALVAAAEVLAFMLGRLKGALLGVRTQHRVALFLGRVHSHSVSRQFRYFGAGAWIARSVVLVNPRYVSMGTGATIGERSVVTAWDSYEGERFTPEITIGANTSIGAEAHLTAVRLISIGNGVLTGKKITITDNSHGTTTPDQLAIPPMKRRLVSKGPVIIEDNVWIGDKATILSGVRIGKGAIVAANAVVTTDVPEGCIVGGIPATILKRMLAPGTTSSGPATGAARDS